VVYPSVHVVWPMGVDSLVEVLACGGQARQVLVEHVLLGPHAVALHVLGPVQLAHVKVEHLRTGEGRQLVPSSSWNNGRLMWTLVSAEECHKDPLYHSSPNTCKVSSGLIVLKTKLILAIKDISTSKVDFELEWPHLHIQRAEGSRSDSNQSRETKRMEAPSVIQV